MLLCFPDYGKCGPEYITAMVASFSFYSEWVQTRMAGVEHGLVSKHSYVPTIADARAMGDEFKVLERMADHELKPSVFIAAGSSAFRAWENHLGKSSPTMESRQDGKLVKGWHFPTEYPTKLRRAKYDNIQKS